MNLMNSILEVRVVGAVIMIASLAGVAFLTLWHHS